MQHSLLHGHGPDYQKIKHVLLVDDSPDDIALTRRALARAGFTVHLEVFQQKEAILQHLSARQNPSQTVPDLVLIDLSLPKVDGLKLISQIREQPLTRFLPVVALGTSCDNREVVSCYEAGASSYIFKATEFTEYAHTLREVCAYWLNLNITPMGSMLIAS